MRASVLFTLVILTVVVATAEGWLKVRFSIFKKRADKTPPSIDGEDKFDCSSVTFDSQEIPDDIFATLFHDSDENKDGQLDLNEAEKLLISMKAARDCFPGKGKPPTPPTPSN